jgi:hypothetical protein
MMGGESARCGSGGKGDMSERPPVDRAEERLRHELSRGNQPLAELDPVEVWLRFVDDELDAWAVYLRRQEFWPIIRTFRPRDIRVYQEQV